MIKRILACVAVVGTLVGCANGFHDFYRPTAGVTPEMIAADRVSPPPAVPIVERSQPAPPDQVLPAYFRRGYAVIGSAMFNGGGNVSEDQAIAQGKSVGADLVLIFDPRYTGTVTTAIPVTTPTTSTTYTTGNATAYGPGGTVTAHGNSTSTTYGSTTNYVPMSVNRSDYGAVYFIKRKQHFGAVLRDLNETERSRLQTNKGLAISVIVDGAPAYLADLLVGDIITAVDGTAVTTRDSFNEYLRAKRGQAVVLDVRRGDSVITKTVQTWP